MFNVQGEKWGYERWFQSFGEAFRYASSLTGKAYLYDASRTYRRLLWARLSVNA